MRTRPLATTLLTLAAALAPIVVAVAILKAATIGTPRAVSAQTTRASDALLQLVPATFDYVAVFEGDNAVYPYVLDQLVPQMFEDRALGAFLKEHPPSRLLIGGWINAFPHAGFLAASGRFAAEGYEPARSLRKHLLAPAAEDGWFQQIALVAPAEADAFAERQNTGAGPPSTGSKLRAGAALVPPDAGVWLLLSPDGVLSNNPLAAWLGSTERRPGASAIAAWLDQLPPDEAVFAFKMRDAQAIEEMTGLIQAITGSLLELTVEHEGSVLRIRILNLGEILNVQ